jgi:antitoxin component YwqK of YwqJK toxin-antitoxin module
MKATLFALFVALPMFGCGESSAPSDPVESPKAIDLDDKETREKIAAEAIEMDEEKFQMRGGLIYASNQQTPYTGWVKELRDAYHLNEKTGKWVVALVHVKDGKPIVTTIFRRDGSKKDQNNFTDGKVTMRSRWYTDGSKRELNVKDGKKYGLSTHWYDNGQKEAEVNWKDGKLMSAVAWKRNGEKCPVTNVKDGTGVIVYYNDDGTEISRDVYKDGERVD